MSDEKPTAEAAAQSAEQSNELTINDLASVKAIIDLASQRGAFKPTEMIAVGQTYAKISAFLENVAKQAEAQKQANQGA
jgi:hypothetical protein